MTLNKIVILVGIETAHIEGDFILTTKQIELGIITYEILNVIRNVSSDKELKGWMSLTVDCVVYYPKSKEVDIQDFINLVMDDQIGVSWSKPLLRTTSLIWISPHPYGVRYALTILNGLVLESVFHHTNWQFSVPNRLGRCVPIKVLTI